jgi:hypothetical protein
MRKEIDYTVTDDNRDKGRTYHIQEMSARRTEAWAAKILLALMAANVELPDDLDNLSSAHLAQMGMKALTGLSWPVLEPILDEMLQCVSFKPDPVKKPGFTRMLQDVDIEEVTTLVKLRAEVWNLHMGFLMAVAPSLKERMTAVAASSRKVTKTSRG